MSWPLEMAPRAGTSERARHAFKDAWFSFDFLLVFIMVPSSFVGRSRPGVFRRDWRPKEIQKSDPFSITIWAGVPPQPFHPLPKASGRSVESISTEFGTALFRRAERCFSSEAGLLEPCDHSSSVAPPATSRPTKAAHKCPDIAQFG